MTDQDREYVQSEIEIFRKVAVEQGESVPQTADEWLAMLREDLASCELAEKFKDVADPILASIPLHKRLSWQARNRERRDQLRRVLADPELPVFLVDLEDRLIYGESVREGRERMDGERN